MATGVKITESTQVSINRQRFSVDRCYMVGTSNSAQVNKAIAVKDVLTFATSFPGTTDKVLASVRAFFRNSSQGRLYFVSGKDPAVVPLTDKAHLIYALTMLGKEQALSTGYLVIPDAPYFAAQADRTAIYSAAETLAQKLNWMHLSNSATATATKEAALTERALYASVRGHSAFYYGFIKDPENIQVPVAAFAAAIAIRRGGSQPFVPPAGVKCAVQGAAEFLNPLADEDFDDLIDAGINAVRYTPVYGNVLWGARTLAVEEKFQQINTRLANNVAIEEIKLQMLPFIFESSDPQGYTRREIIRVLTSIMQAMYDNGGLSNTTADGTPGTVDDAYKIEEIDQSTSSLRSAYIKIYARFVDTLEYIEIDLINTDVIPVDTVTTEVVEAAA